MEVVSWQEKYSVGVSLLDSQHKKLVSLINDLYAAMKDGRGKDALQAILNDIITYTKDHFRTEEAMMQKANYPAFAAHKIEHDKLTSKAVALQEDYKNGKSVVSVDVLNFLRDWLINHIEGTDKKYKGIVK